MNQQNLNDRRKQVELLTTTEFMEKYPILSNLELVSI